jgi:hypothetical protein
MPSQGTAAALAQRAARDRRCARHATTAAPHLDSHSGVTYAVNSSALAAISDTTILDDET